MNKFILMKIVHSKTSDNYFIIDNKAIKIDFCTTEFSTFGAFSYYNKKMIFNKNSGSLIRIKRNEDHEGGIARNLAVVGGLCVILDKKDRN
jgi:hypothetical protein